MEEPQSFVLRSNFFTCVAVVSVDVSSEQFLPLAEQNNTDLESDCPLYK